MAAIVGRTQQEAIPLRCEDAKDAAYIAYQTDRRNDQMNRFRYKTGRGSALHYGNAPRLRLAKDDRGRYRWLELRKGKWVPARPQNKRAAGDNFFVATGMAK